MNEKATFYRENKVASLPVWGMENKLQLMKHSAYVCPIYCVYDDGLELVWSHLPLPTDFLDSRGLEGITM